MFVHAVLDLWISGVDVGECGDFAMYGSGCEVSGWGLAYPKP